MFKQLGGAGAVVLLTALGVTWSGPLAGVAAGLTLASLLLVLPAARTNIEVRFARLAADAPHAKPVLGEIGSGTSTPIADLLIARLSGPLTFLSQGRLMQLLDGPPWPRYVVLDLSAVSFIDSGGANEIEYLVDFLAIREVRLVVAGCSLRAREALVRSGIAKKLAAGTVFANLECALDALTTAEDPPREAALARAAGF